MTRMIGWMSASCVLTVVLPLMFGYITDLLDPQHTRTTFLALMLALYRAADDHATGDPLSPGHHA